MSSSSETLTQDDAGCQTVHDHLLLKGQSGGLPAMLVIMYLLAAPARPPRGDTVDQPCTLCGQMFVKLLIEP